MAEDQKIREAIAEIDPEAITADGWDDCVLGTAFSPGRQTLVVYDGDKIIDQLAEEMTHTEAEEFFSFNIEGAWVGDRTPIFVRKLIF